MASDTEYASGPVTCHTPAEAVPRESRMSPVRALGSGPQTKPTSAADGSVIANGCCWKSRRSCGKVTSGVELFLVMGAMAEG